MIDCCVHGVRTIKALSNQRLVKTWRTPIQKAAGENPDAEYKWLHDIADGAADDVRTAFLNAIKEIRGTLKEAELHAALETGNVDKVVAVLNLDQQIADALRTQVVPPLEDTMIEAGRAAPASSMPKGGELRMRFDLANPNTTRFLRSYEFDLIKQISDDTRTAIRGVVQNAFAFGGHPTEQARQIKTMIGLTDNQVKTVARFREKLEAGDRAALRHELRDHRFDPTLDRALGQDADLTLTDGQIDKMVARYSDRMLADRAENIARTETINAAQAGQQLAWEQASEKGLLSRTTLRQGWLLTPDDRLCIYCAVVPAMNPGGVPLGGYFQTPLGPVKRPTLHPRCRCSLYLLAL